jgi:hypothetical protein
MHSVDVSVEGIEISRAGQALLAALRHSSHQYIPSPASMRQLPSAGIWLALSGGSTGGSWIIATLCIVPVRACQAQLMMRRASVTGVSGCG